MFRDLFLQYGFSGKEQAFSLAMHSARQIVGKSTSEVSIQAFCHSSCSFRLQLDGPDYVSRNMLHQLHISAQVPSYVMYVVIDIVYGPA